MKNVARPAHMQPIISFPSSPRSQRQLHRHPTDLFDLHLPGTRPMNALSTLNDLLAASSASDIIL